MRLAEEIPGQFTRVLGKETKRHGVFLIVGILQAHPTIPMALFNSAVLIDPEGEVRGVQQKMHLPGEEKQYFCLGNAVSVFATELGNIGILFCADGSFPEVSRILALKGAEILCGCYNVTKSAGGSTACPF